MTNAIKNATEATINTAYLIESDADRLSYPALQADIYQPRSISEAISIGLAEDSFNVLPESSQSLLNAESKLVTFGDNDVLFFALGTVRIVLLGMPKLFKVNKDTGEYSHLVKGQKLAGTKTVTIARMFVLLLSDQGAFILGNDGNPQVFTLNLKSSKTELLGNAKSQAGDGSIASLNNGLRKHYKVSKGWLAHLVSVLIVAKPQKFTSSKSKESSMGIMFSFEGNAKILPELMQKQVFDLLQDDDLKQVMSDPFGLGESTASNPASESISEVEDMEAIPF